MMRKWLVSIIALVAQLSYAGVSINSGTSNQSSGSTYDVNKEVAAIEAKAGSSSPSSNVLKLALEAYNCAVLSGTAPKNQTLTIIDYSMPASDKRMWVINLTNNQILFNNLVAHGQGS